MTESADLVIVGAGVVGSAIAYQVARRSAWRVVVVEKATGPAAGSSGDSLAISRCRYTEPAVVRLARHGQEVFRHWAEFTGLPRPRSCYTKLGALWVLDRTPDELAADHRRLVDNGAQAELLSADDLRARWPAINPCVAAIDVVGDGGDHLCRSGSGFLFEEEAGFVDPAGANQDLVEAARREGAEFRFASPVVGLIHDGGAVTGVELASGDRVDAPVVVNAAGPWCNALNVPEGAARRWTLTPTRIQMIYRAWSPDAPRLPIIFDGPTASAYRLEASGEQMVVVAPEVAPYAVPVDDPDSFRRQPDSEAVTIAMACFEHRVPGVEHRSSLTGTSGLYTINEQDNHPVLGPSEVDGLWLANGFSGHGFKLASMIGSLLAQALVGETASFDTDVPLDVFGVDRDPLRTTGSVFA